ncbi:hypothetical protein [Ruegeria lacuscaerulensis]|uniref:hypothetical protein n=1 Tax=Ruegeria lacuscaerulensis TaxID=55218 RepID=UPI00147C83DC|nr:hypothetical protein [Ruegeria lacuscaerulensis]
MNKPKAPEETAEQKAQRQRAQADNLRAIQEDVSDRTVGFNRQIRQSGLSIVNPRSRRASRKSMM